MNPGEVRPLLRDVQDRLIGDRVEFTFVNQTLRSRDRAFTATLPQRVKDLPNLPLPAQPHGFYQVFISPERYQSKSVFISVVPGKVNKLETEFFIRADKARPRFPSFETLSEKPEWAGLSAVLGKSGLGAFEYLNLAPEQKGCLLNLHAKMQAQQVSNGKPVFSFVQKIVGIKQDRVFFRVARDLLAQTRKHESAFGAELGTLHTGFSGGFERVASFKTREKMGNLQLTFAENAAGDVELDADLDDHRGILHAFDVLRHTLTGEETHPFNIHQVLVRFHHIDPGYDLT